MEKFYIVTKESGLYKEYWNYKKALKENNNLVKEFFKQENIKANKYYADEGKLYIVPTEDDLKAFNKILNKEIENGLRQFSLNSIIAKKWTKFGKENNIKSIYKPIVAIYFSECGKSTASLFSIEDTLYCSYEMNCEFENPKGFKEIKASEFFKAIGN